MRDDHRIGILFVYPNESSFVAADHRLLSKHFRVLPYRYRIEKHAGRRFVSYLFAHRREYEIVFCWFGDIYATIAVRVSKLLRKRVIIVAGGYDTTHVPSIGYGLLANKRKRTLARRAFSAADRVLAVDESLKGALEKRLRLDGSNIEVVHTGYDPNVFRPVGVKDPKAVLTVSSVSTQTVKLKGLDTFVETAIRLPDFHFRIVGPQEDRAKEVLDSKAPSNLQFAGPVPHAEIHREYQSAQVYMQLSITEGLPNALAEAMLCECVPVVTRVGGIPTLVGESGFYVPIGDPVSTAECVVRAAGSGKGPEARRRIADTFHIDQRERALRDTVVDLAGA